jgi:hypothetical protein
MATTNTKNVGIGDLEAQAVSAVESALADAKVRKDAKDRGYWLGSSKAIKDTLVLFEAAHRKSRPLILWGPPGVGKTSLIHAYAASKGLIVRTLIGSTMDPSDVDGLPALKEEVDEDGKPGDIYTVNTLPEWARDLIAAGEGILFLDELSTAPGSVQAAMLSLIQNGRVGQHTLPKKVWIIAAANEVADAADGFTLAPPTANRLLHLNYDADFATWAEGLVVNFGEGDLEPNEIEFRTLVVQFLKNRKPNWNKRPESDEEAGKAWPSPRSWANACEVAPFITDLDLQHEALKGFVGKGAAGLFYKWRKDLNLPDYSVVMSSPGQLDWAKFSAEEKYVILENVLANMTPENVIASLNVYEVSGNNGANDVITALSTRLSDKVGDYAAEGILDPKDAMKAMRTILPFMKKANLIK